MNRTNVFPAGENGAIGFRVAGVKADDTLPDGTVLSLDRDTDGDGLNDAAEDRLSSHGFDWQVAQSSLVSDLFTNLDAALPNLHSAGFYRLDQVQALHVGTPLLQPDPGNGHDR